MTTRACELDHLVVTSPTLAAGVKWLQETLEVAPQAGEITSEWELTMHWCGSAVLPIWKLSRLTL